MENNSLDGGYTGSNLESPGFNIDFSDPSSIQPKKQPPKKVSFFKIHKYLLISVFGVLTLTILAGVGAFLLSGNPSKDNSQTPAQKISSYAATNVPVSQVSTTGELELGQANKVTINGQINVNSGLVLSPTSTPSNPVAGQFYFDQASKQAYYYNGTQFVSLGQSASTNSSVSSNVSSIQGLNGTVSFTGGSGILLNGTTVNNSGVISIAGANGLQVSAPSGNVTIGLPQSLDASASPTFNNLTLGGLGENGLLYGGGTGQLSTVNTTTPNLCLVSSGSGVPTWSPCAEATISGTTGSIAMYSGPNQLGDSILTQSGTTIQVGGDIDVSGDISGDGSNIINLDVSNVASGVLPVQYGGTGAIDPADARTDLDAAQSGINADITSLTDLSSITPATSLAIGASNEPLYLQGSSSTTIAATDSGYTTTLSFQDPTTTANIALPNNSGTVAVAAQSPLQLDSTGTLSCTNCLVSQLGSGGGGVLGVVSVNSMSGDLAVASGVGLNVVNSNGVITLAANQDISTSASPTFAGLTLNGSLGVGTDTPGYPVDVNGDVNTSGQYLIDGVPICTVGGCTAASGNGSYIENTTTIQSAAFALEGSSTSSPVALIRGANGQSTNVFTVQNFSGTNELDVSGAGYVGIDKAAPAYPLDVNGVINTNSSIDISGVAVCASSSGCTPAAGSNNYIQNSTTTQTGVNFAIQSAASPSSPTAVIKLATGQATDLLDLENTAGANLFSVGSTGQGYFAGDLGLNTTSPAYPLDVNGNINISSGSDYLIAGSDICDSTGCIARGGSGSYIQNSTTLQSGDFAIQNSASSSSTTALIKQSSGQTGYLIDLQNTSGTNVFDVSPTGVAYTATSLGVGVTSPAYAVDVSGDVNITGDFRINGFAVCTSSGCSGSGSSGSYIQNSTTDQSANFSITSAASTTKPTAIITQATSQTGDLLDLDSSSSSIVASFSPTGQLRIGGASSYNANLNVGTNTTTAAGGIYFGTDTDLYRSANDTLKTDGTLDAGALDEIGADYSSGLILQSNTSSSTRSTNLEFVDNESTPQSIGLRKEGNNLVVLDNSGNVQLGFNPSSAAILFGNSLDTSLYRSGTNALTTAGLFTVDGQLTAQGDEVIGGTSSTNSTNELEVQNASGTNVLEVDTLHDRVGIDTTAAPVYTLDVNGDVNIASGSVYRIGSVPICQSAGCIPSSGSSYYIQNTTTSQGANFNITSASTNLALPTAVIGQETSQTGDLLDFENSSGSIVSSFNASGQIALDNAANYSGALTIGNSSDTTAADAISFGGDTDLYRSAAGTLTLQGTSTTVSLQAANVSGVSQAGTNLDIASGTGTGSAGGGNINLQVSPPVNSPVLLINLSNGGSGYVSGYTNQVYIEGGYIYYIAGSSAIGRANLDGSNPNNSFITVNGANMQGLLVTSTNIYWSDYNNYSIGEATIGGGSVNDSFITLGTDHPFRLTSDGTYLYWSESFNGAIGRALLNGTSVNTSFISSLTGQVQGIYNDGTYLYWSNIVSNNIGRALLNGTSVNANFIVGAGSPQELTSDGTYLYWANNTTDEIGQSTLAGTNVNEDYINTGSGPKALLDYNGYLYYSNNTALYYASTSGTQQDSLTTVESINGSSGAVNFENATNSTDAFQIQDTTGTALFNADTVDEAVDIVNGTTATPTNGEVLYVGKTDSNASTSTSEYGSYFGSAFNPQSASTAFYYGIYGNTSSSSNYVGSAGVVGESISGSYTGTGSLGTNIGLYATANNTSTGTVTSAFGLQVQVQNSSTGTITKGYGLEVRTPVNSGTISTQYGLYIQAQAATGITNAYGIYETGSSDSNYFGAEYDTFESGTNSSTAFQIQNASGTDVLDVDTTHGQVFVGSGFSGTYAGYLNVKSSSSGVVGEIIQGTTSQSADLLQLQNTNEVVLSGFSSNGSLYTNGENITINALAVPSFTTTSTGSSYYYEITAYNAQGQTVASSALGMANDTSTLSWTAVPGATGYYIYRNTTNSFTSGSLLLTTITNGSTVSYTDTSSATTTGLPPTTVTGTGLTIQGWSTGNGNTQSGNELNIENATGSSLFSVFGNGVTDIRTNGGNYNASLNLGVVSNSLALAIRGISGQTADLQEFQNSSGTVLSEFTANGSLQGGNASGTNVAGTNLTIAGGEGTGTGSGGNINFNIYAPGSTGSTNNTTASTALSINGSTGAATFENASNSNTAFQIQNTAGSSVLAVDTTLLAQPTAPTLTTSATGGTFAAGTYYYELSAVNANGATVPVASNPTNVTTTGTTSSNTLTWTAVSGATDYIVYRSSNAGATWSSYETTSTSLIDTNLYFSPTTLPTSDESAGYLNVNGIYKLNGANVLQESGYSLFVGNSGNSTSTGYANTGVGQQALLSITSGTNNAALGTNALQSNTSGSSNAAVGINSLGDDTTGGANTAEGSSALRTNSSGSDNTGVGSNSLYYTTGSYNIGLGYNAGVSSNSSNASTSGSYDAYLGYDSGDSSATQLQNSTSIGAYSVVGENNALVLGCINGVNGCTANTYVGIDNSSPGNLLSIGALTTAAGTYQIAVSTNGTTNSGIVVQTVASQTSGYVFQAQSSTGAALASIDYQGNLSVQNATVNGNLTVIGHYISGGSTPTVVTGSAAGSGSTVSISGNDTLGTITVTTGTSTSTAGTLATLSFASSYGSSPRVIVSPSNAVSAGSYYYAGNTSTTGFDLDVNAIPSPGTTYTFNYFVGQ